jgi:hypothetical protein
MFQPVNPDSRLPSYLQNSTKENVAAQLAVVALFIGGIWVKDAIETKRFKKAVAKLEEENTTD